MGYQVAEASAIQSLTFAEESQLKHIDHRAFRDCKSLAGTVIIPEGVEDIEYGLFVNCTNLKAVKLPSTFNKSTEAGALFSGCTTLEFVQMLGYVETIPSSMFENCYALKAISFPEGITTIDYKALRKCTSLQAVYLPSSLTNLGRISNWNSSDWGVFYQSPNVYLVNEPFNVFDGDTLLGDNFVMPEKPEVYYMPSGLSVVGNSEFQDCTNLNNCIVFPSGVTTIADCSQGAFCNIGKGRADNPVTLVFLGDMTTLQIRQNDSTYSNIHYVFANPNDVDLSSVTVTIGAANNKNQTNTYMYFCAGKVSYDLSTFKAANSTTYVVLETDYSKTTYTDENQPHFVNPKETKTLEADCENDTRLTTYCFCGAKSGETPVEGTALGHSHTVHLGAFYESFIKAGYNSYKCERCDNLNNDEILQPLFANRGYSVQQNAGSGILAGFAANWSAIDKYEALTNKKIEFGTFAVLQNTLGDGDVINENGSFIEGSISTNFSNKRFDLFELKITGFTTDTQKETMIAIGAYVIESGDGTKVSYIQADEPENGAKYSFVSYNSFIQ